MALERNALIGAIERRKRAKTGNQQMQKMNSKRNRVFKPENTQATDNMPQVKQRPQVPTDNMPRTKQRQPTPMPQPRPRPATDNMPVVKRRVVPETPAQNRPGQNALMAKKLQAMRNGLGTRMGG